MRKYSTIPLEIVPLKLKDMLGRGVYTRPHDSKQSTEFTYLRFLVPYLNNYEGWALFADDDFLWLGDIADLVSQIDDRYALMCVKHDYQPSSSFKLANLPQEAYPRKNWSSMMLINCSHPANRTLTLDEVNVQSGSYLHQFRWIDDEGLIGEIDYEWNFLVNHYMPYDSGRLPKAIHYTEGGPWFPDHRETGYASLWLETMREYELKSKERRELCPYERFSVNGGKILSGYSNSHVPWDHSHYNPTLNA